MPFLAANRKENVRSEIDNRMLLSAPTFGEKDYTKNLEAYFQDRIGFRSQMVSAYNVLNDKAFHELTHPLYTYGKNNFVFFKMHKNIQYNDYHKTFAQTTKELQNYCESRGARFYLLFDPEKLSIYRQNLPNGVNYSDYWVTQFCTYLNELGVNYVNTTQLLTDKSQNEDVFNRIYDAGHWNDLGCFYATNALWEQIHKDYPSVTSMKKNEFTITKTEATTLPTSNFKISEITPSFKLKQPYLDFSDLWQNEITRDDTYSGFFYQINMSNNSNILPRILFFQGSYYNRNPEFIVSRSSDYIGIHNYQNILNLPYYFNIFRPDIVVLDVAEYVFKDQYFSMDKMKSLDFNPAIITDFNNFTEEIEQLKSKAIMLTPRISTELVMGEKVDKVTLTSKFLNTRYAYLITNDQVYDFARNADGFLELSVEHGAINYDTDAILYFKNESGIDYWASASITEHIILTQKLTNTDNALVKEQNNKWNITYSTTLDNNEFNSIQLQLQNSNTGSYIDTIEILNNTERIIGKYKHVLPTDRYKLVLKANSNLQDESVCLDSLLVQGQTYYYVIDVSKLNKNTATVNEFSMYYLF